MYIKRHHKYHNQIGQSLLEVVMVAFVLVMALVALISLTTVSIARNRLAKERVVAIRLAQEGLEWVKYERDRLGFDAISLKNDQSYCLAELPLTVDGGIEVLGAGECSASDWVNVSGFGHLFQRSMQLSSSPYDPDEVKVVVIISWRQKTTQLEGAIKRWER